MTVGQWKDGMNNVRCVVCVRVCVCVCSSLVYCIYMDVYLLQLILKATTGMGYNEFCDYLLCIGEVRLHEREQAILRLKGTQPQSLTARSCDKSCDTLTACDMERQQSRTPLLHQYLPDSIRTIVSQYSPGTAELPCCTDLAVVAYRSYELNKIESVLRELVNSEVMEEMRNECREKVLKFLKDLNECH